MGDVNLRNLTLRPGSIVLKSGEDSVQIGLDRRWALRFGGLTNAEIIWLQDAARRNKSLGKIAVFHQLPAPRSSAIIEALYRADLLLPIPRISRYHSEELAKITAANPDADLPVLNALRPDGQGYQTLLNRATNTVAITSSCRLGASLAIALAAAGVGRIIMPDTTIVQATDLSPYRTNDIGNSRFPALRKLIAEFAPAVTVTNDGTPDAVVCVEFGTQSSPYFGSLIGMATPHLPVVTQDTTAEVGPFVLPNKSACVHCLQLTRADADPDWPALIPEIAREPIRPVESVILSAVITLATAQILAFVDDTRPRLLNAIATVSAPDGMSKIAEFEMHPGCGCAPPDPNPASDSVNPKSPSAI